MNKTDYGQYQDENVMEKIKKRGNIKALQRTCSTVKLLATLSLPACIWQVDKASMRSLTVQPIKLAAFVIAALSKMVTYQTDKEGFRTSTDINEYKKVKDLPYKVKEETLQVLLQSKAIQEVQEKNYHENAEEICMNLNKRVFMTT